jgi:ADP-ribose pyrophosphatase YjhB (NUDIX family)
MVGVGAVILRDGHVLLVQRGREPAYGFWSLPGGLVEVGESLRAATRREVREEVGLEVEVGDVVAVLDRILYDVAGQLEYHYVLIDFVCTAAVGEPMPASDVLACAFVPVSAIQEYPLTRGTAQVIFRAVERMQGKHPAVYEHAL